MPTQARQDVIGVVRPVEAADRENTRLLYYDEVVCGVLATIRQSRLSLLVTYLHGSHERDSLRLRSLAGQVDGLLVADDVLPSQLLIQLAEWVPVVVLAAAAEQRIPPLATAALAPRLLGERACTLLLKRIASPEPRPRAEPRATELTPDLPRGAMDLLDLAGIRNGT